MRPQEMAQDIMEADRIAAPHGDRKDSDVIVIVNSNIQQLLSRRPTWQRKIHHFIDDYPLVI